MLLNCHSYYSLNYGCLSVEDVLQTIKDLGHANFVITDINNTSETFRFLMRAEEYGIKANIGIDFRNGVHQQYIGIAKNKKGFFELNEHLSHHLEQKLPIDPIAPNFDNAYIIYPLAFAPHPNYLKEHEFIGISPSDLKNTTKQKDWKHHQEKLVVLCTATFRTKRDYNTHRLLRAIGENMLLSKLPPIRQGNPDNKYRSAVEIKELYEQFPQILKNTKKLLKSCKVKYSFKQPKNKLCFTQSKEEDIKLLTDLSHQGLEYRFKTVNDVILKRLDTELKLIEQCDFCAYFLINWDLVCYAQRKGYCYVGRGSGANSLVAYLLRITNVDPIDLDLYFERFINPYRNSPPDFDVDFSWTDRDDITKYLFDTYGWDKVALLGSYQTFQRKAVIRELGKVFGLPDEEIKSLQRASQYASDTYGQLVQKYSTYIAGFPSHLSIHSSGILISEEPIHYYSSTTLPPKNFPTTHFDMQIAEDIGLYKYDILSQRGLGKIKDALVYVKQNHGITIDIDDIDMLKSDPKVKELLRQGDLTGCFYVESPAMRMLLTKLKAEDYTRLVAASSIIRPGVSKSGMMREYIVRFQDEERRNNAQKALPELYKLLEETYGVMVYQEDVIKVAHFFAGLTLAEADILRRGMSCKFRERTEFAQVEQRFFDNCHQKGYAEKTVQDIWHQIESFANYAFSKGHSASYAVESFQALYIHAYYPLEYLTATLNNGGGFYSMEFYAHTARMKGGTIALPCVNNSDLKATLSGKTIHLGLVFINGGFGNENVYRILKSRRDEGPFLSFRDFVDRLPEISLEQIIILIRLGCFRCFEPNKKKLMWDAHFLLSKTPETREKSNLFRIEPKSWKLPELIHTQVEDAYDEMELLGFPVTVSPFSLIADQSQLPTLAASELPKLIGKTVDLAGYRVTVKSTKTSNHQIMQFGTFVDQKGDWIDTVIFPNVFDKNRVSAPGCYKIRGRVSEEFGHITVDVEKIERLEMVKLRED